MIRQRRASNPATPSGPGPPQRRAPMRLWPLLFVPVLGLLAGIVAGNRSAVNSGHPNSVDYIFHAVTGLVAGSLLMSLLALGFLAVRLAVRQYTLRSMLIAVAAVALALGVIRACFP